MSQITTLTFYRYAGLTSKVWAFGMMQFAHAGLKEVPGLCNYKLMGSGRDGFDPRPDWSVYALLQIWESESAADHFFASSRLIQRYQKHAMEHWRLYLRNLQAHGEWNGANPFEPSPEIDPNGTLIAVITRATIKWKYLRRFWAYVPTSQRPLQAAKGLLFTKGIGEVPFTQMATFSLWEDKTSLMAYAYASPEHQKAIKKTRELDWYKEELFSRFQPYRSQGTWFGKHPLAGYLP
jgi:heme-degrading monooxygenase HmoA